MLQQPLKPEELKYSKSRAQWDGRVTIWVKGQNFLFDLLLPFNPCFPTFTTTFLWSPEPYGACRGARTTQFWGSGCALF